MKKTSPKNLPALYIGRFQPPHLGHIDAIKQILRKEKFLIIGIGSAQYFGTQNNPFTGSQRYSMLTAALQEAKIPQSKYTIIPIPNIEDYAGWPNYVDSLLPPYGLVYTGSAIVKKLYENQGKHKIKPIKFRKKISGTLVREKIMKKENWETLVPKSVAKLIKKNLAPAAPAN
ncbi:nicotinamide-nucleotide adenylyltransferase [Candidatus Peregrinibacteria bacterium]|nr:nicotinamide-nucleotide adenylyltransferase [Candidatus Peregrinibacteria bacterium]